MTAEITYRVKTLFVYISDTVADNSSSYPFFNCLQ